MTTKIFNIKSALTARIIYKNISLFLNQLDKILCLPLPPGARQGGAILKLLVKL